MPIISVEIIKTTDKREMQNRTEQQKKNKQRQKGARETEAIAKG